MAKDLTNFSVQELIDYIAELKDQLDSEKYGLYWDKSIEKETKINDCLGQIPLLVRNENFSFLKSDNPTNLLICGDCFHSLAALSLVESGSIDVIYIDPPYNTGNKNFIYNDKYVNSDDCYKHSKWLSFMSSRLRLAKQLLKDTGYIFISIDEHEVAQLKLLCDSIFGEKNCLGVLTWESSTQPTNAGSAQYGLQLKTEFILFYKQPHSPTTFTLQKSVKERRYPNFDSDNKPCRLEIIEKSSTGSYNRDTMKFQILGHFPREGKRWQIGLDTARELEANGRLMFSGGTVKKIVYPEDEQTDTLCPFWSHFSSEEVGTAQFGKKELKGILGFDPGFDTVKPVRLIKELLFHTTRKDSVVLDFFAGSGTTGQAVLELNNEDGGSRRFILCQNNESNICNDITYSRLTTVISGKRRNGSTFGKGFRCNLAFYEDRFISDEKNTEQAKYCLVEQVDELLCIKEDIYLLVDRNEYSSHYSDWSGKRHMFIYNDYFDPVKMKNFSKDVEQTNGEIIVYVFASDNFVDPTFFSTKKHIEVKPIPSKIYEIYKEIVEDIKRG